MIGQTAAPPSGVILKKLLEMSSILTKDASHVVLEVTLSSIHSTCVSFLCEKKSYLSEIHGMQFAFQCCS